VADKIDAGSFRAELPDFNERINALRVARRGPHGDPGELLDATMVELDLAQEELRVCNEELSANVEFDPGDGERELLRRVQHELTTPVVVVDHQGKIRFANRAATAALSVSAAYLNGSLFVTVLDVSSRAVFRTRFSAAVRGDGPASWTTRVVRAGAVVETLITLTGIRVASEERPLVIIQLQPIEPVVPVPAPRPPEPEVTAGFELMSAIGRLLIDDEFTSESVLLGQAGRLITAEFADWATIDLTRSGGLRRVAVARADGDTGGVGRRLLERQEPADLRLLREVAETGKAVLQPHIADESGLGQNMNGVPIAICLDLGSLLIVPIRTGDRVEGVLTLLRRVGRPWFVPSDLTVAAEVGEQLAIALRTARNRRHGMAVTHILQESLLPAAPPTIPRVELATAYAPALNGLEVGGDFYEVFGSRSGWGFVLGDASGRGEEASAISAMVRHGAHVLGFSTDRPQDVLRQLNEVLVGTTGGERFVTAVAGHLRWAGAALRVRLASAGHPPPVVLRAEGAVEFTPGGGLPLGAFANADLQSADLSLYEGDTLLVYADGVTEARDGKGRFYTDARLTEVLMRGAGQPACALVKSIEQDVTAFTGGLPHDDVALLAMRVVDGPALLQ
jgi:sigma-B regulation protein RsbU (phosphoserine phosphatase)